MNSKELIKEIEVRKVTNKLKKENLLQKKNKQYEKILLTNSK